MKHVKMLVLGLILIACGTNLNAQDFSNPVEYLDYINAQYGTIMKEQWDYTKAISKGKGAKKVEKRRLELLQAIKTAKANVFKMPRFKGDASFKSFVIKHLDINYIMVNEDYAKIVDMEEVAEQSYDLMEAYLLTKEKASDKLAAAAAQMEEKVQEFADANGIRLIEGEESKLSKKMRNAGAVWSYYNKYYLTFFKAFKQESFCLEALGQGDVSAVEQNRNAMITYATEGLDSLKKFKAFNGDATLMKASQEAMDFFKKEGEERMPYLTDYFIKKEKFEKIKANFDKIKPSKRTKADVDNYNKAIDELNKASAKYNEVNELLNKERSKMLNNWNKAVDSFLKKHVA